MGEAMPPIIGGEDFVAYPLEFLKSTKLHIPNMDIIKGIQVDLRNSFAC
jgi:hypothetical protein